MTRETVILKSKVGESLILSKAAMPRLRLMSVHLHHLLKNPEPWCTAGLFIKEKFIVAEDKNKDQGVVKAPSPKRVYTRDGYSPKASSESRPATPPPKKP